MVYTREGNVHKIFIDGMLSGNETNGLLIPGGITAPLTIGAAENGGWVKGSLDQVRIYNRALSAAEIFQLRQLEAGPVPLPLKESLFGTLAGMAGA